MRFGSVCSGIEAASVAWPFWEAAWFSEIEPFPCAVLKHHYPEVPNHGDMTTLPNRILSGEVEAPDVFCGGTPCQAFSVAGNRKSLDDARGNLSLTFCEIADAIDTIRQQRGEHPAIIFWENVPGCLNTKDNFFGCFLAELAGEAVPLQPSGGRWTDAGFVSGPKRTIAWRVLDAQYFGLAQRRRRVFLCAVKHGSRKGFNPSEVLFEFDSLRRDTAPSRQAGQGITADAESGFETNGGMKWMNGEKSFLRQTAMNASFAENHFAVNAKSTMQIANAPGQTKTIGMSTKNEMGTYTQSEPLCFEPRSPDGHARVIGNIAPCLNTMGGGQREPCLAIHSTVQVYFGNAEGGAREVPFMTSQNLGGTAGISNQTPLVGVPTYSIRDDVTPKFYEDMTGTLGARDFKGPQCPLVGDTQSIAVPAAAFKGGQGSAAGSLGYQIELSPTLNAADSGSNRTPVLLQQYAVRRLTPVECERLQGFPDNYTNIPWRNKPEAPDGPRYKALGNSWAVPVVRWIGERINNAVNRL